MAGDATGMLGGSLGSLDCQTSALRCAHDCRYCNGDDRLRRSQGTRPVLDRGARHDDRPGLRRRVPGAWPAEGARAKAGKNRVHIDLRTSDRAADVARLVEFGATVIDEHVYPGFAWTVLTDPAGNEFCIGGPHG